MLNSDPKRPLIRIVAGLAGMVFIGGGSASILQRGDLHYQNWFGGLVFAPFAILFGLAMILSALFKPEILGRTTGRPKR